MRPPDEAEGEEEPARDVNSVGRRSLALRVPHACAPDSMHVRWAVLVDESVRGPLYVLAAVVVAAEDLPRVRAVEQTLLLPGERRLHSAKERRQRRKVVLRTMADVPMLAALVVQTRGVRPERRARQACLRVLIDRLGELPGHGKVVIESRGEALDRDDRKTLSELRWQPARYLHARAVDEPLLWLPDFMAWAAGAAREYRILLPPHERLVGRP